MLAVAMAGGGVREVEMRPVYQTSLALFVSSPSD